MPAQKRKKREWYQIVALEPFKGKELGETLILDPTKSVGRCLNVSLADLINDIKRANIYVRFRIVDFTEGKLFAKPVGYQISSTIIKRMVRRRTTKIEDSFIAQTVDGSKLRIKPFMVTRARVQNAVARGLRKTAQEKLIDLISKTEPSKLIEDIVKHKLQTNLFKQLNKLYPLKHFEIRKLDFLNK